MYQENPFLPDRILIHTESSRRSIENQDYPEADRNLDYYCLMIPSLPTHLKQRTSKGRVVGLDVGCGTGRAAAEMMKRYKGLDMKGVSLNYYPPIKGHAFLPKESITISPVGTAGYDEESFDILLAVGALDMTNSIIKEGKTCVRLLKPGGCFIIAPTTTVDIDPTQELQLYARGLDVAYEEAVNKLGLPYATLRKR